MSISLRYVTLLLYYDCSFESLNISISRFSSDDHLVLIEFVCMNEQTLSFATE